MPPGLFTSCSIKLRYVSKSINWQLMLEIIAEGITPNHALNSIDTLVSITNFSPRHKNFSFTHRKLKCMLNTPILIQPQISA
jgi:hypothetical protein